MDSLQHTFRLLERAGENIGHTAYADTGDRSEAIRQQVTTDIESVLLKIGQQHGQNWKIFALAMFGDLFLSVLLKSPETVALLEESLRKNPEPACPTAGSLDE